METQDTLPPIQRTQLFKAPIQKVWTAIATAEGLNAWFMPNDFEPVVGHAFKIDAGPFGMQPCLVKEIEVQRRIVFEWGTEWTITIELEDKGDNQTSCTLTHSGWRVDGMTEFNMPHSLVRDTMDKGWVGIVAKLGSYVEA
ncbi:SRPBCC domain-containing protein [Paenibacillus rhizovicinus]|uniref:SRPBCC domain-containing protein n=1 Tax=Paenibacillus rhizovicinus TaxID=2704463 RepID=A0A6C0P891_9BACL|nr:SRPBCC domain-containing protein [Paenibacillus rhizovicinus]QHW34611.1 SRPBCC domain-containing protein [Paenibacillus rhizovicinus]